MRRPLWNNLRALLIADLMRLSANYTNQSMPSTKPLELGSTSWLVLSSISGSLSPKFIIFSSPMNQMYIFIFRTMLMIMNSLEINHLSGIAHLITRLKQLFVMKDLSPLHYFLGLHVQHLHDGLHLSQTKYISNVLDRAKMTGARPAKTFLPTCSKLSQHDGDPLENDSEY
jgi:hypothetical protein